MSNPQYMFSFLGTNDYVPVHYTRRDAPSVDAAELDQRRQKGRTTNAPRKYSQTAVLDLFPNAKPTVLYLALTSEARRKNFDGLKGEIANQVDGHPLVEIHPIDIKDGKSTTELWEIFGEIASAIPKGCDLACDFTHGFRSLPMVGVMALAFLRSVRHVNVNEIYYGAFEVLGIASEVKQRKVDGLFVADAPIFRLGGLLTLSNWSDGIAVWDKTARADVLVELSEEVFGTLRKRIKKEPGGPAVKDATDTLVASLKQLNTAMQVVHNEQIVLSAGESVTAIATLLSILGDLAEMRPLQMSLTALQEELRKIEGVGAPAMVPTVEYLRGQVSVVQFFAERGRLAEGIVLLDEAFNSLAVLLSERIPLDKPEGLGSTGYRNRADYLMRHLCGECPIPPTNVNASEMLLAQDWKERSAPIMTSLRAFRNALTKVPRNSIAHAWANAEPKLLGDGSRYRVDLLRAKDAFNQLLDTLVSETL